VAFASLTHCLLSVNFTHISVT